MKPRLMTHPNMRFPSFLSALQVDGWGHSHVNYDPLCVSLIEKEVQSHLRCAGDHVVAVKGVVYDEDSNAMLHCVGYLMDFMSLGSLDLCLSKYVRCSVAGRGGEGGAIGSMGYSEFIGYTGSGGMLTDCARGCASLVRPCLSLGLVREFAGCAWRRCSACWPKRPQGCIALRVQWCTMT